WVPFLPRRAAPPAPPRRRPGGGNGPRRSPFKPSIGEKIRPLPRSRGRQGRSRRNWGSASTSWRREKEGALDDLARHCAGQVVAARVQLQQPPQPPDLPRDPAAQLVPGEEQRLQRFRFRLSQVQNLAMAQLSEN
ncbi:unnamed protein product, partial [Urochloa humidicola]